MRYTEPSQIRLVAREVLSKFRNFDTPAIQKLVCYRYSSYRYRFTAEACAGSSSGTRKLTGPFCCPPAVAAGANCDEFILLLGVEDRVL